MAEFTGNEEYGIVDLILTMEDIDDTMMNFKGKRVISTYMVTTDSETLLKNKSNILRCKLYESPNMALATIKQKEILGNYEIIQVDIDLSNSLDLLDYRDLRELQLYCDKAEPGLSSEQLIRSYANMFNKSVIRYVVETKDSNNKSLKVHKRLNIKQLYIRYIVIDTSCIKSIKVIEKKA